LEGNSSATNTNNHHILMPKVIRENASESTHKRLVNTLKFEYTYYRRVKTVLEGDCIDAAKRNVSGKDYITDYAVPYRRVCNMILLAELIIVRSVSGEGKSNIQTSELKTIEEFNKAVDALDVDDFDDIADELDNAEYTVNNMGYVVHN
jgi:hypothetical protein